MIYLLPALKCQCCGQEIAAVTTEKKPASPNGVEECLRRCGCGKGGYSNAQTAPTWIFKDPAENVPVEVRTGLPDALAASLNLRNRKTKSFKFGFETSEDAVTWTAFRYLQDVGRIRERLAACGNDVASHATGEPSLLLWGTPVPNSDERGRAVGKQLTQILVETLNEPRASHSEPDVILDFGRAGTVVVEAKYRSANDRKAANYQGWKKYIGSAAFRDPEVIKNTGLYELARNWRIAFELTGDGPASLVNLGTAQLQKEENNLASFKRALASRAERQFQIITWAQLFGDETALPPWLRSWLGKRDLSS